MTVTEIELADEGVTEEDIRRCYAGDEAQQVVERKVENGYEPNPTDVKIRAHPTIYYRPTQAVDRGHPGTEARDWERFVGTTRKAKQRAGACCIPYKKSYKCDGICDTCEFRCIPKDAPQHLSIDTEMENAYENGRLPAPAFLADSRLTTEIDIDSLILNGLLTELQSSDPESYEILMAIADGLSERAGAERLQMPRNTFVYKRNQLLRRLKEKFLKSFGQPLLSCPEWGHVKGNTRRLGKGGTADMSYNANPL